MKYALYGLHRGSSVEPDVLAARARRAEEAGFEGLWVGDHIALPADAPDPPNEPRLEAVTALTFLAAATTTVGLGLGVLVLPQRQPVLLAKQLASLDRLSRGRLVVGVGAGHVDAELRALGVEPSERGGQLDEHLAVIRRLWADQPASFVGRWTSFSDLHQSPPPLQRPGPPVIIGGHAPAALRRAAQSGDGWFGWELDPGEVAAATQRLSALSAEVDRSRPLEITITPKPPFTRAVAEAYARVGVTRLVLQPRSFVNSEIDHLIEHAAHDLIDKG